MLNGIAEWRQRVQEERAVKLIRQRVALVGCILVSPSYTTLTAFQRIMTNSLMHWTTRVADLKLRELETTQNYERRLMM